MEPSAEPHYAGYQFPGEPLHRDGTMTGSGSSAIDIQPADGARLSAADTAAIDAIFFASSNTQQFASDAARHAFRDRWLGCYLTADPRDLLFLARSDSTVVGYCLGAVENAATQPRFAGIAYFCPANLSTKLKNSFYTRFGITSLRSTNTYPIQSNYKTKNWSICGQSPDNSSR